ncbi:MAG: 3-deoxy-7-phosphoheptulonate synthase [Clostridiaceae bacterium]|jgi:3-deoxy-7-phosphoheptulonate synthase|nr:3-deoxy-7-phosphoheptulonate synthase [Oscillospiraceae bacterium]NLO62992.1 3-deoxy-7-phosphoheptulonate synthase [Clostridiaceae bacterium]
MIIVVKPGASRDQVEKILGTLEQFHLKAHVSEGAERLIIGVIGDKSRLPPGALELLPAVEKLVPIMESYKLASRAFRPEGTAFEVKGVRIGGTELTMMAGPCAVESEEQVDSVARVITSCGARFLRGGAYKPRTTPYSFQGLEKEGLRILRTVADRYNLLVISEITSENDIDYASDYIDIIQIGARNAQNFRLLSAVGKSGIPVMLKRGIAETIDEWLGSVEYIMSEGNYKIIMCERGIRTFETSTRSTLDISAVPVLKSKTHLPVIVDPSHASGKAQYVRPLSLAAIAAGADGLIIEVHPNPICALSDAAQQITPDEYRVIADEVKAIAEIIKRTYPQ